MNKLLLFVSVFCFIASVRGIEFQVVEEGPLHEAFMTPQQGNLLLELAPNQNPPDIQEIPPEEKPEGSVWIPGYWSWYRTANRFLWVSGIYRRPPPGKQWISGSWKIDPDGWVWIPGYWGNLTKEAVTYLDKAPPAPYEEKPPLPPSTNEAYFWVPGTWEYEGQTGDYHWLGGRWERMSPEWIYVPAHYIWQEKGYVFVPGFWDWPLEKRGRVFYPIYVDPSLIDTLQFTPTEPLNETALWKHYYPQWPNYSTFFYHHFYCNQELWAQGNLAPPWWNWPMWWTLSWPDSWWLWWWWSHPGYASPPWLTEELAVRLPPPSAAVVELMRSQAPPPNVTANGVVSDATLLQTIHTLTGERYPFMPSDPKQAILIQQMALPQAEHIPNWLPGGEQKTNNPVDRPFFGPPTPTLRTPPKRITLPPPPDKSRAEVCQDDLAWGRRPSYSTVTPYYSPYDQQVMVPQYYQVMPHRFYLTPQTPMTPDANYTLQPNVQLQVPYTPKPEYPIAQPSRPRYYGPAELTEGSEKSVLPETLNQNYMRSVPYPTGRYEAPIQGYYKPPLRYSWPSRQNVPMMTEHHDYLMTQPQPQRNPPGPNAHQVPGDYSTLPYQ